MSHLKKSSRKTDTTKRRFKTQGTTYLHEDTCNVSGFDNRSVQNNTIGFFEVDFKMRSI